VIEMKRRLILLAVTAFVVAASSAFAGQATSSLNASASVNSNCNFTTVTDIAFGTYDPTDPVDTDADGDFTFRCSKGTAYDIYLTGTRQMTKGADTLNFELYSDAGRTTVWPSISPGVTGTAASNAPDTRSVYGRVSAQQDAATGAYSGSVTITIDF
jgi:spore coat protein U-like protein